MFDRHYVKRLDGPNVKKAQNKRELAEQLRADIRAFKQQHGLDRLVMVWCGSTEIFLTESPAHQTLDAFERALEANDPAIPSSMIYAYAALMEGVPYANGAPNLSVDVPALMELAQQRRVPIAGKDFKTGQTLIKTIIAPGLKARLLGVNGLVLHQHPRQPRRRGAGRPGVVQDQGGEQEVGARLHPPAAPLPGALRRHLPRRPHQLLPAARRQQGRLGQHRSVRVARLPDAAQDQLPLPRQHPGRAHRARPRAVPRPGAARGHGGIQEWLSFYFKSPMHAPGLYPEHDLFIQLMKLKNTLRWLRGEDLITHLGREYYD